MAAPAEFEEAVLTIIGVGLVAVAHVLNVRHLHRCNLHRSYKRRYRGSGHDRFAFPHRQRRTAPERGRRRSPRWSASSGSSRRKSRSSATWRSCRARRWARRRLADGDRIEIVISSAAATIRRQSADAVDDDTWTVAGRTFRSRLIVGTGKYKDYAQNAAAAEAAGAEIVTVALRRVNLSDPSQPMLVDYRQARPLHLPAQHRRLLHRRGGGAHPAPGARGRRLGPGQAGGAGRRQAPSIPTWRRRCGR